MKACDYPWQFKEELKELVKNDIEKGNSVSTTMRKLNDFLSLNEKMIKSRDHVSVWSDSYNKMKMTVKCFEFLKTGFYKPSSKEWFCAISEIKGITSYTNGKKVMINQIGEREITDEEFEELKLILN